MGEHRSPCGQGRAVRASGPGGSAGAESAAQRCPGRARLSGPGWRSGDPAAQPACRAHSVGPRPACFGADHMREGSGFEWRQLVLSQTGAEGLSGWQVTAAPAPQELRRGSPQVRVQALERPQSPHVALGGGWGQQWGSGPQATLLDSGEELRRGGCSRGDSGPTSTTSPGRLALPVPPHALRSILIPHQPHKAARPLRAGWPLPPCQASCCFSLSLSPVEGFCRRTVCAPGEPQNSRCCQGGGLVCRVHWA